MSLIVDKIQFLTAILDEIEEKESRLLVWGLVDSFFTEEELESIIEPILNAALDEGFEEYWDASSVISVLQEYKLIFPTESYDGTDGYR